jgi:hypothetical protein
MNGNVPATRFWKKPSKDLFIWRIGMERGFVD